MPDEVGEVADKIIKMAALEQEGKFKTDHENDVLTHSLGNPEHPGRVEFILIIFFERSHMHMQSLYLSFFKCSLIQVVYGASHPS